LSAEEPVNKKVYDRLEIISRLIALGLVKGIKSKQDQVEVLDQAGLSPTEIGDLLGMKAGTVRVTLFNIRQSRLKAKKRA